MWESYTQERERIPTAFLYPESVEVATQPDARPATERIQAEDYDFSSGVENNSGEHTPAQFTGNVLNGLRQRGFGSTGAVAGYRRIDFGDGVSTVRARAKGTPAGDDADWDVTLDFRIGGPEGESIGTLAMQDGELEERTADIDGASGVHDVYVVNTSPEGNWHFISLDWFTFE
jgi:arabinoxylan arabinofuranohydrolase